MSKYFRVRLPMGAEERAGAGCEWIAFLCVYLPSMLVYSYRWMARRRHTFNLRLHLCCQTFVCVFTLSAPVFVWLYMVFKIQTSLTSKLSRAVCCLCVTFEAYSKRKSFISQTTLCGRLLSEVDKLATKCQISYIYQLLISGFYHLQSIYVLIFTFRLPHIFMCF